MSIWKISKKLYKVSKIRKNITKKQKIIKIPIWTAEQLIELKENYFYYFNNKKEAETRFGIKWIDIQHTAKRKLNLSLMKINKKCAQFLGCHIAERVLSHVFKDVKRMPLNNKGYDFICNKGFKIEVKSSCLSKSIIYTNRYTFQNLNNKTADYFLLIGFDNRDDLNPQHIWLIKKDEILRGYKKINEYKVLLITNNFESLSKLLKYELTDKLKETIECCNTLKLKE